MPLCRMIDGGQRTKTLTASFEHVRMEAYGLSKTQIARRRRKTGASPAGHRLALKRNEATMRKRQEDEDHQAQRYRGCL